jgi:hypothetical protein
MEYMEMIKNNFTGMTEIIRFRKDSVERFFTNMEAADNEERVELINSLYNDVIVDLIGDFDEYYKKIENEDEIDCFTDVKINGKWYDMHTHMLTAYLVCLFYNTQYWGCFLEALSCWPAIPEPLIWSTRTELHEKLTKEPIENFIKEVQIVNPEYSINS